MTSKNSSIKVLESKGEEKKKTTSNWLKTIYGTGLLSLEELGEIYDTIKYHGFNRESVLAQLEEKIPDPKTAVEVILVCSLRGPQAASLVKLRNGKTLKQMGIPPSGAKGTDIISCQRISAATADIAAFYFKKLQIPKRLIDNECPAHLQFPSAGSIKMPNELRLLHIDFSKKFSALIGGTFNESIYNTMVVNSYLDESLQLFE